MNACLLVLCLSLGGAPEAPRDRFFGEDKWKHLFTSFVAASLAASAARAAGLDADASAVVGAGAALTLGAGKEWADLRRPGATLRASVNDMIWNAAGAGAAAVVVSRTR